MHAALIRPALESDLPPLLQLWEELMHFHAALDLHFSLSPDALRLSEVHLRDRILSDESVVLVAEQEKALVGYCVASIREKAPVFVDQQHGYITDLAVSAPVRGSGIGEHLFLEAKQWLQARKINRIELRTITVNDVSNSFWEKLGFRTFAEEKVLLLK